ncbi:MAG: YcxB family protein [Epulopiscium sp.]|nr:YcxB family protein [Candidatus Epulonipiscium sp.]
MHIKYEIKEEDYIQFNLFHVKHSPTIKRNVFIQRYIISLIFLIIPFIFYLFDDPSWKFSIPVFFGIYLFWVFYYPKKFIKNMKKNIEKMMKEGRNDYLLGPCELWITEEGIHKKGTSGETKTKWETVEKIARDKEHLYIYIGSLAAYIIPLRAFVEESEKEMFVNIIQKYISTFNK